MRTKIKILLLVTVLIVSGTSGCKKILRHIDCAPNVGGPNLPFVATYPDRMTYRGRTDDQGIAHSRIGDIVAAA